MQIVVGSGKGGTGKTLISTSLARSTKENLHFLDCDVEEPNSHIFLQPALTETSECTVTVPEIDLNKCTLCGKCRDICRFNAITMFGSTIMTFPDMCHSCGGCFLVCQDNAIREKKRLVGHVESGSSGNIHFTHGKMRVGEAMAVPLIKAVKKKGPEDGLVIIDAPPGTSCPFVETVSDADYVILVTEPTPFGLHDLQLTVIVLRSLKKNFGVIINRADLGNQRVQEWCKREKIPLLMEIPFERTIAEGYARGNTLPQSMPSLVPSLQQLLQEIGQ